MPYRHVPGSLQRASTYSLSEDLDSDGEEESWRLTLPLSALPISISVEADIIDIVNALPFDLVESIIDYVYYSTTSHSYQETKATLKTCSLVSKEWSPRSRRHLMDMSVVRLNRVNADAFLSLTNSPHFGMTRIPHLELSFRGESTRLSEIVVPILTQRVTEICSLLLDADALSQGNAFNSLKMFSKTKAYKRCLTRLSLTNHLPTGDKLFDILPFVYAFPQLERLSLEGTFRGLVNPSKVPGRLRVFEYTNTRRGKMGQVLHWLCSPKSGGQVRLERIFVDGINFTDVEGKGGEDAEVLQRLLESCKDSLEVLELAGVVVGVGDVVPDLRTLHRLRHLSVSLLPSSSSSSPTQSQLTPLQFITKLLLSISREAYFLERIDVQLRGLGPEEVDEGACKALEEGLEELGKESEVKVRIETNDVVGVLFKLWMGSGVELVVV